MSTCAVRVFRSFGLMRVVAIVVVGCFCVVMIVPAQLLDVAIRSCHQPKHDAARRHDAEADVNLWLP